MIDKAKMMEIAQWVRDGKRIGLDLKSVMVRPSSLAEVEAAKHAAMIHDTRDQNGAVYVEDVPFIA